MIKDASVTIIYKNKFNFSCKNCNVRFENNEIVLSSEDQSISNRISLDNIESLFINNQKELLFD